MSNTEVYGHGCRDGACGDLANDCCAPRTEVKRCELGLTAYCKTSDCCFYVCCDTRPDGYFEHTASGLEVPWIAALVSTLGAVVLLLIVLAVYYYPIFRARPHGDSPPCLAFSLSR